MADVLVGSRIYVAPKSTHAGIADGSLRHPFTLEQARLQRDVSEVVLRGGEYLLSNPLVINGRADGAPIVYRSHAGERARLLGGIEVPASALTPVNGSSLLAAELRPLGVTDAALLGGDVMSLKAELFEEEAGGGFKPMQLARSPGVLPNGLWQWVGYENITASAADGSWLVLQDTDVI